MRKIRILTDSASDIPLKIAERLDIKVLPIPITHDGKSYHERVEFSNEQFYQLLLESRVVPFTSHINANTYLEEYKKAYEQGYTQILNVTINSLGSSMFDSANLAKRMFYEETGVAEDRMRIEVMDSKTYTIAYGLAVIRAAEMADRGIELDDIVAYLSDWFDRLEIMFSVYSLDFVKKSGRVGCAAAFVGELLGLRPVIVFVDGVASIIDKIRGDKNVVPRLVDLVKKRSSEPEKYPFAVARGTPAEEAANLAGSLKDEFKVGGLDIYTIGASIAINCGPKVVAVIYAGKKRGG